MLNLDDILQKVLNDDFEREAIEYLTKEINKELKKSSGEIDLDRVCDLMYEKIQLTDWNNK